MSLIAELKRRNVFRVGVVMSYGGQGEGFVMMKNEGS